MDRKSICVLQVVKVSLNKTLANMDIEEQGE
jgi:hypothetical protein